MRKFALALLTLMLASAAFANSEGGSINWWGLGSAHKDQPALGWYTLTFVIFLLGLVRYLKKPLQIYLETRSNDIAKAINEANIARQQAEKRLLDYERRVVELDADLERLKADFIKQGEAEKKAFQASAEALSRQIALESEQTLKAEVQSAMQDLKKDMALRVIEVTQKQLEQGLNFGLSQKLKHKFADELRNIPN